MTPVDNQSRGKFRLWRAATVLRAVALDRAFNSSNDIDSLFYKAAVGRGRALRRLRAAFERHGARWTGTPDAPRWSYINPAFDLWECETRVVSLGCIWADRTTNALFNRPIWCFAASEHACLRFFQRSRPGASLTDALFEAHANTLGLSTRTLIERKRAGAPFYRLAAGEGAFATDVIVADKKADNGLLQTMFLFGRTWLHWDNLTERQEAQIVPQGAPGDRFSEILWQPVPDEILRLVPTYDEL
jgi:hypothetical protein